MFNGDLLTIIRVYFISLGLGLISFPIVKTLFRRLPDNGWSLTRLFTTMTVSIVIWELGNMGLAVNNDRFLWLATGVFVLINILVGWDRHRDLLKIDKAKIKVIILEEYLFLMGLTVETLARGFLPNIDSLEKFMDFGFVNRYLNSSTLPAMDMWQAGKSINYYSFGHFWASIVIRYMNVFPTIGYNLMLGMVAGLATQLAFGVVLTINKGKNIFAAMMGGVIGAFSVNFAGNSHILWYMITHKSLAGYWYADATRFIHNTIHEFPGYSFVVADLHGHLLDLPVVLAFLILAFHWFYYRRLIDEVIMGITFGIMMMTNTWDVAVYGLFLVIVSLYGLVGKQKKFWGLCQSAGVMLLFMALTALPWWLSFQSISNGIAFVKTRSELWQLAALWVGGLTTSVLAVILEGKGERKIIVRSLAVTILLLILIPEFVYAKDIYPDHPRANTMFKLTYQASVMIGVLVGVVWGKLFDGQKRINIIGRILGIVLVLIFFTGTMIFPAEAFTSFYGNFMKYQGLNGEDWLVAMAPEKYRAILFLRDNRDGKNLVEAVGDSYSQQNAVSVFASIPSIQGWRVHEWLWRGGYDVVGARTEEVRQIYESDDLLLTKSILNKYNVGWILVGPDELHQYILNHTKLKSMGEVVWREGDAYIIKTK